MNIKTFRGALAAFLILVTGVATAAVNGEERLRKFVASVRSAEGEFQQTVTGETGKPPQRASGKFAFARPGKFRWEYDLPYPQLLVADGKQLWSWDRDLKQVTVRPLGNALGATPAAILFGQGDIDRDFILSSGDAAGEGSEGGKNLVWVDARPRQNAMTESGSSGFQLIRFGFNGERLQRMALRDNFGQITVIEFTSLRLNPGFTPDTFRFEPPAGVDILGDPLPPQ
jgi:outer membrane lipoprotein carrier protein